MLNGLHCVPQCFQKLKVKNLEVKNMKVKNLEVKSMKIKNMRIVNMELRGGPHCGPCSAPRSKYSQYKLST